MTVYFLGQQGESSPRAQASLVAAVLRLHARHMIRPIRLPPALAAEPTWARTGCGVFVAPGRAA